MSGLRVAVLQGSRLWGAGTLLKQDCGHHCVLSVALQGFEVDALLRQGGCLDAQSVESQSPGAVVFLMQDRECHDAQVVAPQNLEVDALSVGYGTQAAVSHRFEVDMLP